MEKTNEISDSDQNEQIKFDRPPVPIFQLST